MKDTNELLEYIKVTGMTANELLYYDVNSKIEKKFNDAINKLNSVVDETRKEFPDAHLCVYDDKIYFNLGIVQDMYDYNVNQAFVKDKIMNLRPQLIALKSKSFGDKLTTGEM